MRTSGLLVGAVLVTALSACSSDVLGPMRPAAVADDQRRVSAMFDDALNLPEGAEVKLGGVVVGKVVGVDPADYRARVRMAVDDEVPIPAGSRFRLRYTTGLGEVYVDVVPGGGAPLADGATVDAARTSTAPTVEDSLASASLLVNGGSLGQVQTIVRELNTALGGRVDATKGMLDETDRFLGQVLRSTRQIDRALVALRDASGVLDRRERTIDSALQQLPPAVAALDRNTDDLARLLRRTDAAATTADRVVTRTRDDLTVVVQELGPVVEELVGIRDRFVPGLDRLALFARRMNAASPTDYLNLKFLLHLDSARNDDEGEGPGGIEIPIPIPGVPDLELPELPDPTVPTDLLPEPTGGLG